MQCTIRQHHHIECNLLRHAKPVEADECVSDVKTSGSAMAEGTRDALVSRNSATYKTSHLKTSLGPIVWHYLQTDGQTHDDGMYRA